MKLATMVDKALMSVVLPGTVHSPYAPMVFLVPTEVHTVYILNPQGSPSDKLYSLRNISTREIEVETHEERIVLPGKCEVCRR
jgi:hypothetical protein